MTLKGTGLIITRTPFRVSLFGGGTDYPGWYRENPGAVLGFAINRYCYLTVRRLPPFFEHKHRIVYSQIETTKSIQEIQHPAVRAILSDMNVTDGLEIHYDGDLPARSGLGSSSSFSVGLIGAIHALRGKLCSKEALAREALRIEQEVIGETVGSQDQIWAAYGGCNRIEFQGDDFRVTPLIVPDFRLQELTSHLVLFFTGQTRFSTDIANEKVANIAKRRSQLRRMYSMVNEAQAILSDPQHPIEALGELLHEGWTLKRELASVVTNSAIDEIYEAGRAAGAIGGKLLGAGGGGFLLFMVPPEQRQRLRTELVGLTEVDIDIDYDGSRVVLFEPDRTKRQTLPFGRGFGHAPRPLPLPKGSSMPIEMAEHFGIL